MNRLSSLLIPRTSEIFRDYSPEVSEIWPRTSARSRAMLALLGVGALLLVPGAQHRPAPRRRCRACVAAEPVPLPTSPKDVATQMSYAVQASLAP